MAQAKPAAFVDVTEGSNACTEDGCASSCHGGGVGLVTHVSSVTSVRVYVIYMYTWVCGWWCRLSVPSSTEKLSNCTYVHMYVRCTSGFNAAKGWDPVTGLGVPQYSQMLAYIKAQ